MLYFIANYKRFHGVLFEIQPREAICRNSRETSLFWRNFTLSLKICFDLWKFLRVVPERISKYWAKIYGSSFNSSIILKNTWTTAMSFIRKMIHSHSQKILLKNQFWICYAQYQIEHFKLKTIKENLFYRSWDDHRNWNDGARCFWALSSKTLI